MHHGRLCEPDGDLGFVHVLHVLVFFDLVLESRDILIRSSHQCARIGQGKYANNIVNVCANTRISFLTREQPRTARRQRLARRRMYLSQPSLQGSMIVVHEQLGLIRIALWSPMPMTMKMAEVLLEAAETLHASIPAALPAEEPASPTDLEAGFPGTESDGQDEVVAGGGKRAAEKP